MFEDPMVEKEVDIRKRILRDFNKKEEDFSTLREYNDYLEEIETLVFNLSNNIEIIETNKKIEQYKKDNKEQIMKNKTKLGRNENELLELMEYEKQQIEERKLELIREEMELKKKKLRDKEALIDELMFSEGNAKNIVDTFASSIQSTNEKLKIPSLQRATQFSTGIKFGQQGTSSYLPLPKVEEGPTYCYTQINQITEGPIPPTWHEVNTRGYLAHVRAETKAERAGGFKANIACLRALQEAMVGLYHNSSSQRVESMVL